MSLTALLSLTYVLLLDLNGKLFCLPLFKFHSLINIHHKQGIYDFDLTSTIGNAHAPSCDSAGKPGGNGKVWSTLVSNYDSSCYNISVDTPSLAFIGKNDHIRKQYLNSFFR